MSKKMASTQKRYGFSLLEMMIALVIAGILLAVGGTYLHNRRPVTNLNGAATRVWGEFQNARSAAIRRNAPVVIRWSSAGVTRISNGEQKANIITYVDLNGDGSYSSEDTLVSEYSFPKGVNVDTPGEATFRFTPKGYFEDLGGGMSPWDFVLSTEGDDDSETRGIRVFIPGSMRYFYTGITQDEG